MSRISPSTFLAPLFFAIALLVASPSIGAPITYELQQGVENGFGFSGLHDADDNSPMSGSHLGDLNGKLVLDYNDTTSKFHFVSSTVALTSNDYTFSIVSGMFNADGSGHLGFEMQGSGGYAQTGRIVYAPGPVCCGPTGPNRIDNKELRLWGAVDIQPSGGVAGKPKRFGMDLGANAVPEPSAAMVFGIGMVLFGRVVRKNAK